MALLDAAGTAAGVATATGAAILFAALGGLAAGQATVVGDVDPQAGGTAAGVSTASGEAANIYHVSASAVGDASASAAAGKSQIVSGYIYGVGQAQLDPYVSAEGQADGVATVTGNATRLIGVRGRTSGVGSFLWVGAPLPIHGRGFLTGSPVVETHLPAVRAIVSPPKTFRYLQLLQRGDLPIYLCDRAGPVSPVWVRFSMYQVLCCGKRQLVGPNRRIPVQGEVGEYYAVGRAGELGQPGCWVILWEWRQNLSSATQSKEMDFQVADAVLAADPLDSTVRYRKYGWN